MNSFALVAITAMSTTIVGLLTWAGVRRRTSGKVATTEASTLWDASEKIRVEQREEIVRLRLEVIGFREELVDQRITIEKQTVQILAMKEEIHDLKVVISDYERTRG